MSEVNDFDHQALQYLLTEGSVDWAGIGQQIAREIDSMLGGSESVFIFDECAFTKNGGFSAGVARLDRGLVCWARWIIVRFVNLPPCVGLNL